MEFVPKTGSIIFNNSSMAGNELNRSQIPKHLKTGGKVKPAREHLGSEGSFPMPLGRAFRLSFPSPLRPFPFLNRHYIRAQGLTLKCVVIFSSIFFSQSPLLESWQCHRRKETVSFSTKWDSQYLLAGYCEGIDYLCVVPKAAQHTVGVQSNTCHISF